MHPNHIPSLIVRWQPDPALRPGVSEWLFIETNQQGRDIAAMHAALAFEVNGSTLNASPRDSVLIVPAEMTLNTRVRVPSTKLAHIQAAVPHLIEEWILADLDTLHLSMGERNDDGHVAVNAIDSSILSQTLSKIEAPHLRCRAIYVDAALLPYAPNTLTLLVDGERALFRWSSEQAGAIETTSLIPLLSSFLRQQSFESIDLMNTWRTDSEHIDTIEHQLTAFHQQTIRINRPAPIESLMHFFADRLQTQRHQAINLRQGKFAQENSNTKRWQRWKPLTIAATILLAAQLGLNLIAGWRFSQQADHTHEQAIQLYRELFPEDKRIVNVRQQFQNHLNQDADTDQKPFFTLFGDLTREIQNTSVDKPIQLRSLLYDKKSVGLQVELIVPSVPVLDDLQKRLSTSERQAKITSAENADGIVIGRLTLAGKS